MNTVFRPKRLVGLRPKRRDEEEDKDKDAIRYFRVLEIDGSINRMSKHRLYYSARCRFCQAFLEELAATSFVPEFQLICVDPSPGRPPLPGWLKTVPSLVVAGEDVARVGPGPVNNWLFERKLGGGGSSKSAQAMLTERNEMISMPVYNPDMAPRPDATARMATPARNAGTMAMPPSISGSTKADPSMGPPGSAGGGADGPSAYHMTEMSGSKWSDNYSFLGGAEFTSDKGYDPISRNFESLLPAGMIGGAPASTAAPAPKRSAKEDELLRQFEAFSKARDSEVAGPIARR